MKKTVIILFLIFAPCSAYNYNSYCTDIVPSKTISGIAMSTAGVNFLARKIVQKEMAKAFKKETGSDFKVNMDSFWGVNIANGEFYKFSAVSENYSDKYLSAKKLEVVTVCPYNKINYENNKLIFDSDMVLKFNAEIDEYSLSKMLKQKVQILNDKICFIYKISAFGIKASLKLKAGLEVVGNKIQLCNIEVNNKTLNASKYLDMLNLTNFNIDLSKDTKAHVQIDDVKIKNSNVYLTGHAIIPKG